MARRPPVFVRNPAEARHINIAHGLYPRQQIAPKVLDRLATFLSASVSLIVTGAHDDVPRPWESGGDLCAPSDAGPTLVQ